MKDQTDEVLDLGYGYVGSLPHLLAYFSEQVRPDAGYLSAVRARFQRWILDLCNRPYDQDWLNYQHEVAKRYHSTKKNRTDGVVAAPMIHYRYMTAFIYSTTAAIKPFLAKRGQSGGHRRDGQRLVQSRHAHGCSVDLPVYPAW